MKLRFLVLLLTMLCASEAFANNYFIPNYYRNRRFTNNYSAVGWSNRKEAGLTYSVENVDSKSNGSKTSKDQEMTVRPHVYYRTPQNVNIEAALESSHFEGEMLPASGPKRKRDGLDYNLGLGYEASTVPMAFGLVVSGLQSESKSSSGIKSDFKAFDGSLGVGYRLTEGIYLGAGYSNAHYKTKGLKEDKNDRYALGVGKVFGDRTNPTAASEAVLAFQNEDNTRFFSLFIQGLINTEQLQYTGSVRYSKSDGKADTHGYALRLGADYKYLDFYVGPQVSYSAGESKASGFKSKSHDLNPSLEAGYRIEFLEAFLRYTYKENENKTDGTFTSKSESASNVLTANVTYKF